MKDRKPIERFKTRSSVVLSVATSCNSSSPVFNFLKNTKCTQMHEAVEPKKEKQVDKKKKKTSRLSFFASFNFSLFVVIQFFFSSMKPDNEEKAVF